MQEFFLQRGDGQLDLLLLGLHQLELSLRLVQLPVPFFCGELGSKRVGEVVGQESGVASASLGFT